MKKILFIALSALITSTPIQSFAYGYLTYLSGPGVTIKTYFVHNEGGVSLILNEAIPLNPDNCGITNHVYLKPSQAGHHAMVSAALAAFAAGKRIGLHGHNCEIIPFWGGSQTVPTVSELWVFQ